MQRRDLLKSATASAAGLTIMRSGVLRGQSAPSNKLNIALIGVWGRGTAHYSTLLNENVVARIGSFKMSPETHRLGQNKM